MNKIRKYQVGGWTPNFNFMQGNFAKYGVAQSSLIGDFNSLKNAGNFSLTPPSLGLNFSPNSAAIPSGVSTKAMGNNILSDIRAVNTGGASDLSGRALRINNRIQKSQSPEGISKFSDAKLQSQTDKVGNLQSGLKANGATKGGVSNMSSGLQSGLSAAGSILGGASAGHLEPEQAQMREGTRSAISSAGPIGAIIGAASGVVDAVGAATGLNLDNMDKNAAERAGIKGGGVNNLMNAIPGNSMIWGAFMGKTAKANKSAEVEEMRDAYSGSVADIDAAQELGDKRFLFGKKKANKFINESNARNALITDIGYESNRRKSSTYGEELASQNYNKYSGQSAGSNIRFGKFGMKLSALEEARKILKNYKTQTISKETEIEKFAEGGKMNVIAQGALHSRKNHLDEINDNLCDVTSKGIPVISLEEGGEITQHAEIEGGELILTKELTIKLEKLYKNGSEEAMIEAGKLLSEEIIENTDDKTNEILDDENND